jgi:hypothetical protein
VGGRAVVCGWASKIFVEGAERCDEVFVGFEGARLEWSKWFEMARLVLGQGREGVAQGHLNGHLKGEARFGDERGREREKM